MSRNRSNFRATYPVLIGYMGVNKADGRLVADLQRDAPPAAGAVTRCFYGDHASGAKQLEAGAQDGGGHG